MNDGFLRSILRKLPPYQESMDEFAKNAMQGLIAQQRVQDSLGAQNRELAVQAWRIAAEMVSVKNAYALESRSER